jgi:hypothetical protein
MREKYLFQYWQGHAAVGTDSFKCTVAASLA